MINSNPETVSTDFDASSRLYFEPLDPESVRASSSTPRSPGQTDLLPAVVAFGGQTPLNLAAPLAAAACRCSARDLEAIDQAEERTRFSALLDRLGIPQPEGGMAHSVEEALTLAERIGYPVIVRPSFVIGGLAIDFCYSPEDLARQLAAADGRRSRPARPHRPLPRGRRGRRRRRSATASGCSSRGCSSTSSAPASTAATRSACSRRRPSARATRTLIVATMERIVLALGARGLVNAQFIVREDGVYLIEVNPRASRTVPFLSKVTGVPMVELAVRISLGATLPELGWDGGLLPPPPFVAVKAPAFSTAKLRGVDPSVGPGMQSTGEVIGIHEDPRVALAKALLGRGARAAAGGRRRASWRCCRSRTATRRTCRVWRPALAGAGYRLAATPGHPRPLAAAGYDARPVAKLGEAADEAIGEVAILDLIATGEVRLVVNTPTPRSGAVRDAAEIRLAATAEGILCLTAMETAVAAAEALDPAIAGAARRACARSGSGSPSRVGRRRWRGRLTAVAGAPALARGRRRRSPGRATTASASSGRPSRPPAASRAVAAARPTMPLAASSDGHDVAGPGAEHVPADDGRELDRPDEARRQPGAGRLVERRAEQVPARWNGSEIATRMSLAVDEQVRQVVGDEVADGDRQQAGAGRGDAHDARHAEGRERRCSPRKPSSSSVSPATAGRPKRSNQICVCESPSNRIDPTPSAIERRRRTLPARLQQAAGERPPADPARPRRQARTGRAARGAGTRR